MNKQVKELLDMIPGSWSELTLSDYQKVSGVDLGDDAIQKDDIEILFTGADNTLKVLSVFTQWSVEELEQLNVSVIQKLAAKLEYMQTPPVPGNTKVNIKLKNIEDITYNSFITFHQLATNPIGNMHTIIKAFSKEELTVEQILAMPMNEAMECFFLLVKVARKSVNNMMGYQKMILKKQTKAEKKNLQHSKLTMQK